MVRELGSAQVEAIRSLKGAAALPRRLWNVLGRVRRGHERKDLGEEALASVVDQAAKEYRAQGFAGADAFVSSQFLNGRERASVYAGLATRVLSLSGRDAGRFGDVAASFDAAPGRALWLAFLKQDAGQLAPAVEALARVPGGHPTTPGQDRRIARIRGYARLAAKPPSIPRMAEDPARGQGRQCVLLVWEGGGAAGYGGRERVARSAEYLAAAGLEVVIAVPGGAALDAGFVESEAIRLLRMKAGSAARAPDDRIQAMARELDAIVASIAPTLVYVVGTYRTALPALQAARGGGLPLMYQRLRFPEYAGEGRVADWRLGGMFQLEQSLEKRVCEHADLVLVATRKQAEEVRRRTAKGVVELEQLALPVPVAAAAEGPGRNSARRQLGLPDDGLVIGFLHEGHSFGGLGDLVKALAPPAPGEAWQGRLLVISSGTLPDRDRRLLRRLPAHRVQVVEAESDAGSAECIAACDVMAFPWQATSKSDLESCPGLLQAMAAGVPVLVSSSHAFSEVAQDGVNARVHAAGNPQALRRCLEDLVGQPREAQRMAAAAQAMASREYSWQAYADGLLACCRRVAGGGDPLETIEADGIPTQGHGGRRLRIAAIMDEFTHSCFAGECDLVQLTPGDWHAQIKELEPDFLLVESAWQGHNGMWEKHVPQASAELRKVIAYCRRKGIRTAFWNKEDPVHFSLFLGVAALVDTVFTTDIDRIRAYRQKLGHDRVYLLPFAAQPRVHNPIERYERVDAFCFAGSYYAKYPERRRDFEQLVAAARALGRVEIYDRNHGKQDPGLVFPPEYQDMVVGTLPVSEIDRAYKGYRYGISVNTVKQSQSMFARRAFELLACNTVTISNFSRGLKLMLGDLVVCGDGASSIETLLRRRIGSEKDARRFRLAGLRKVMDQHTYAHRMAYLAGKVLGRHTDVSEPQLVVACRIDDQADVDRAMQVFDAQSAGSRTLVLVVSDGLLPEVPVRSDVSVLTCHQAADIDPARKWPLAWFTVLDCRDHYAAHYLKDLQLAIGYAGTAVVGKFAHYERGADSIGLVNEGAQYRHHDIAWPLRHSLVSAPVLEGAMLADLVEPGFRTAPISGLAIDEFNYCRDGAGASEAAAEVSSTMAIDEGIGMETLLELSEPSESGADDASLADLPGFHGAALQKLFTPSAHADGLMQVSHSLEGVVIDSRLPAKRHAYAYANRLFKPAELVDDGFARFQLVTEAGLYLNAVVVYLDSAKNKLAHAIVSSDTNQSLPVPPATAWIRFGLRVLGSGETTVKALMRGAMAPVMDRIIGRGDALLITKDYPRYDDLYRYGFVHKRILAYAEADCRVDVFRFSNAPLHFDEFEGVNVVAGQAEHLRMLVEDGAYRTILVHAMDPLMWEHVKPLLETRRVVVWIHGAEIQPWFRRLSNFGSDPAAQDMARRASGKRMAMWEDALRHPHPNLRVVFVSRYLAGQALCDLGIDLPEGQVHVIPNFVDGDLFRHEPKDPGQRKRILSIRPFASHVYANDLTVEAIRLLSAEPFFDALEFTIVGDGPLFDQTVEPLRAYPNVRLEKRFLSQVEIAALHREHGVFLVPSRMDSQGVSRDEAMASGLVPVTSRVAAIPEFVDERCAFMAEPEDGAGLAAAIAKLWADPDLFQRMSAAAAAHVRGISDRAHTIGKELVLVHGGQLPGARAPAPESRPLRRIAIYGDVNLNITDGSAIWAASLAEVLAGMPEVQATLYLKARVVQSRIIAPLLSLAGLRIVEPEERALVPAAALDAIERDDGERRYDAVILRGVDLCEEASRRLGLHGRLWVYLTDVPQTPEQATPEIAERVSRIIDAAGVVLCQTPQFREYMEGWIPAAAGKTRLLPPMVPPEGPIRPRPGDDRLNVVYAGKFAPAWGVREMLDGVASLRAQGRAVVLHVYGDKIHNPADDPEFREEIARRLGGDEGVIWHGAVERSQLLAELSRMDVGWAWRHASLEAGTHELSTKLLEYASAHVPPIMARNAVNLSVFGDDYPLYADTPEEAVALLAMLESEPGLREAAVALAAAVSRKFDFDSVRESIRAQGLVNQPVHGTHYAHQPTSHPEVMT
ncbi:glycosyltransferase [Luteimonas terricola]|uniref:glycosyltransferase n=1 Tax=Luteimonas terricola TaxID=645597 RepID=UPI00104ED663|nr:glycosyltransferase [Luteimonas terricola]